MSELRFVKTPEQLIEAAENNLEFFDANMHAIKAWYKTEPGLIEQLIPLPLEPHADPMVRIVISRVFVDLNGGMDLVPQPLELTVCIRAKRVSMK